MPDISYAAMINVDWHLRRCTPLTGRKHLVVQFKYEDFKEIYTFPGTVDKILDVFEKQICWEEKQGRMVEWFKVLECDIDKLFEEDIPELYFKPELVFMEIYKWPVEGKIEKHFDLSRGFDFSLRTDDTEEFLDAVELSSPMVSDNED